MTLIDRVLAGPGSRELSDEVLIACGWTSGPEMGDAENADGVIAWTDPSDKIFSPYGNRPSPTESIDDALRLVPEGYGWRVDWRSLRTELAWASCGKPGEQEQCYAPTPALALTAAALRARVEAPC